MPYAFVFVYSQLYQFYEDEDALDLFPEEIKRRFQFCLSSLCSQRAQILILKSHKFRSRCDTCDGSAATYWKSAGHGPPTPLSENYKHQLKRLLEIGILFNAGELQTAVCLELVAVGLFRFIRSIIYCPDSIPGIT